MQLKHLVILSIAFLQTKQSTFKSIFGEPEHFCKKLIQNLDCTTRVSTPELFRKTFLGKISSFYVNI